MKHICQKDFKNLLYGDASVSENGCAVCCVAMILDKEPNDIIGLFADDYWDNDFGTLPEFFNNIIFNKKFIEINHTNLSNNDILLLLNNIQGFHYEVIEVTRNGVILHDPRLDGIIYLNPREAKERIHNSEKCWIIE